MKHIIISILFLHFAVITIAQPQNISVQNTTFQEPLRLKLMLTSDTTKYTDMFIGHGDNYLDGVGDGFDAQYMASTGYPGIFSIMSGARYSINATGPFINDKTYKIGIATNIGSASDFIVRPATISGYTGTSMLMLIDSGSVPPVITNLRATSYLYYNFPAYAVINQRFWIKLCPSAFSGIVGCQSPNSITLSNPSLFGVSYQLKLQSDSSIIASGDSLVGNIVIPNLSLGNYIVTFTNQYNDVRIDTINVSTLAYSANINSNDTILDINSPTLNLSSNIIGDVNSTYEWDFGDNTAIDTAANPTHTFVTMGSYLVKLKVTFSTGCTASDSIAVQVSDFTKIKTQLQNNTPFYVSDKIVYADFGNKPSLNSSLEVYNLLGEKLKTINTASKAGKQQISIHDLPDGVYIIKQIQDSQTQSLKVNLLSRPE